MVESRASIGAARVEPRVLHDNRNVGLEDRGVVGVARHRRGILEIIEAQMERPPRAHRHIVGADRLAIGERDGDLDLGIPGSVKALPEGMYPSAIAQRRRPIASMEHLIPETEWSMRSRWQSSAIAVTELFSG
jgi:hypothetical protein